MSYQYPTTPIPQYPVDITTNWNNITSRFDSGKEQSRQKNLYPKYDVTLTYKVLSSADMQILWNFYQARRGSYESFYFYSLESVQWNGVFIGIGDGSTTIFDIPGKSTNSNVIYASGLVVPASDYTITAGAGDCSSDQITFDTAPTLNTLITTNFVGYLRIRCKFKNDKMTRSGFTGSLYTTGLELKGVANI